MYEQQQQNKEKFDNSVIILDLKLKFKNEN